MERVQNAILENYAKRQTDLINRLYEMVKPYAVRLVNNYTPPIIAFKIDLGSFIALFTSRLIEQYTLQGSQSNDIMNKVCNSVGEDLNIKISTPMNAAFAFGCYWKDGSGLLALCDMEIYRQVKGKI